MKMTVVTSSKIQVKMFRHRRKAAPAKEERFINLDLKRLHARVGQR